ncbi:MAG: hypothetical protein HFJ09_03475 [Lachnospiraceae bacterium]|nr:hypothetical protein [Lachnospiraceae bacterium]
MKIGEARKIYSSQLQTLREQRRVLQEAIKEKQEMSKDKGTSNESGVILDLSDYSSELDKKIKETEDYLHHLTLYSVAVHNKEVAKQQGETMAKEADDMAKCMEIARRLSKGDKVPIRDEQKLIEFNPEIYAVAKNAGAIARNKERKEHKSLWEEEEQSNTKQKDIDDKIKDMDVPMEGPEVKIESVTIAEGESQ